MSGFQKFFYGISRAFFDAEVQRLYKVAMLYAKCIELKQLLMSAPLNEQAVIIAELNRILAPYQQISKFLRIEDSALLEIGADNYLEKLDRYLKTSIDNYFIALSVKAPAESDSVLTLAEKMIDFVNAHSFFKIFDYCRQAGEKFKELDLFVKKASTILDKTYSEILKKKRLTVSDINFLTIALVNYQNFSVVGQELAVQMQDTKILGRLPVSEQSYLKETARVMGVIGDQLSACLNSMMAVGENIVRGQNDILISLIAEKNAIGREIAELNKQIHITTNGDLALKEKHEALVIQKDEKILVYESLVHQIQAVAAKLTEEHLTSREELKVITDDIQKLSKALHEVNKTKYLPRERSSYIVSSEDGKHLVAANTVRRVKEKFENLGTQQQPAATKLPGVSPVQISKNLEKHLLQSLGNVSATAEQLSFLKASPNPTQAVTPPLPRAASATKTVETVARSPRTFFGESLRENAKQNNTVSGVTPPPALVTELQEVIKRRPSNPATPRKDN